MDIQTALEGLERLRAGELALDARQQSELIDAMQGCIVALAQYPRSGDPATVGMWFNRDRAPALARLADALAPGRPGASAMQELRWIQEDERAAARSLHLHVHGTLSADGRTTWADARRDGAAVPAARLAPLRAESESDRRGDPATGAGGSSSARRSSLPAGRPATPPGGAPSRGGAPSPGGLTRDKKPPGPSKSARRRSLYYSR